ncbi:ankyrin repeat domain-containing protein [Rickettsia sp. 2024-CO-Wats]|uniref:ankyrin repeat domain-containing protein n=1 Tax=unclassified Rickettsia TaxID=114295 RepID=UPI00370D0901
MSFDTVDSPENKSTIHYVTDLADLKELLQKGIDLNIQDENGDTALEVILKKPTCYLNMVLR